MKPELKKKIMEYNKRIQAQKERSSDADILINALLKIPYGQLKKILNDENVVAILQKYGYEV